MAQDHRESLTCRDCPKQPSFIWQSHWEKHISTSSHLANETARITGIPRPGPKPKVKITRHRDVLDIPAARAATPHLSCPTCTDLAPFNFLSHLQEHFTRKSHRENERFRETGARPPPPSLDKVRKSALKKKSNQKSAADTRERQKRAIANQNYRCECCDVNCRDAASLRLHNEKPTHIRKAAGNDLSCHDCPERAPFKFPYDLKRHRKGVHGKDS